MKRFIRLCCFCCFVALASAQERENQKSDPVTEIKFFPNPANNVINVLGLKNSDKAHIVIADVYGTSVLEHQWRIRNNAINIPIAHLDSGIYLISIHSKEQHVREKFYKQ